MTLRVSNDPTKQPLLYRGGVNFGTLVYGQHVAGKVPGTYNTDYTAAPTKAWDYYQNKGARIVRVPWLWERMFPTMGGAIDSTYLSRVVSACTNAQSRGMKVLLDMHNYSYYEISSVMTPIGDPAVTAANFYDAWSRFANAIVSDVNGLTGASGCVMGYGIMNEPHDANWTGTNASTWAQGAIDAIRTYDTYSWITVPGLQWSHSYEWNTQTGTVYDGLTDASKKLAFEFHEYFWWPAYGAYSGHTWSNHWTGRSGTNFPNAANYISNPRLLAQDYLLGTNAFIPWLDSYKSRNNKPWVRGFCGEIAFPDNGAGSSGSQDGDPNPSTNPWLTACDEALTILQDHDVGWCWWEGGCNGWSNSSDKNMDPLNAGWTSNSNAVDRAQMPTIYHYY